MVGRIVVLISGSGTNMESLADACDRRDVPGEIVAVVGDRDCVGLKVAEQRGIPSVRLDPAAFSSRDEWSAAMKDEVASYRPDLVVSAGFMRILSAVFIDAFGGKLINLHPSLLPAFPGAHGVRDALAAGVRVTGTTVHFMDNEVDRGAIILQEAVTVEASDTEETLHERIKQAEHRMLPRACRLLLEGELRLEGGRVVRSGTG